jgi:type II secretory pathway component PulF
MALILTPAQLARRAELYHQLAQMTEAGIGLVQAVELQRQRPPAASFREPLTRIHHRLTDGSTFADALQATGRWLPAFDVALLQAGERSGRLPAGFKLLAGYYEDRAKLVRSLMGHLAYPVFLLHVAVLIFPITWLQRLVLEGQLAGFLLQKIAVLAPLYGTVLLAIYTLQGSRGEAWRAALERLFGAVPGLGGARRSLALARLSAALEALLNAGVNIIEAWDLAARASGSPALRRVVAEARPRLDAGETPAEMVNRSREFPAHFAHLYHTGEISGQLEESLLHLRALFQEEGSRRLKVFLTSAAGLVILGVILLVAWQVIAFWLGYFQQIQQVIPD